MTKRVLVIGSLGAVAVLTLSVLLLSRDRSGVDPDARAACDRAARFERIVDRNGPAREARAELARAVRHAGLAARRDPAWLALQGGLQTIELALQHDDAAAADQGVRVVRAQCETAG